MCITWLSFLNGRTRALLRRDPIQGPISFCRDPGVAPPGSGYVNSSLYSEGLSVLPVTGPWHYCLEMRTRNFVYLEVGFFTFRPRWIHLW